MDGWGCIEGAYCIRAAENLAVLGEFGLQEDWDAGGEVGLLHWDGLNLGKA